jgi:hypothetical protein
MKVRFRFQSLSPAGIGPFVIPIDCWRVTILFSGASYNPGKYFIDGADLAFLTTDANFQQSGICRVVIGGVFDPHTGAPVMVEKSLTVTLADQQCAPIFIFEDIEP